MQFTTPELVHFSPRKWSDLDRDRHSISVPDFVATVYHALGLNPHEQLIAQGRPMKLLPEGSVVRELF